MEEIYPMIVIAILWLCIGLPISKAAQAKKKASATRPADVPGPVQRPAQTQAKAQPPVREPVRQEARMTPTISVTQNDDSIYRGSLNAFTGEGYDPCHEEDLKGLNRAEASAPAHPAADKHSLPFGWTGNDIVRGIVISEILNRKKTFRAS